jgi:hypothetical protein
VGIVSQRLICGLGVLLAMMLGLTLSATAQETEETQSIEKSEEADEAEEPEIRLSGAMQVSFTNASRCAWSGAPICW